MRRIWGPIPGVACCVAALAAAPAVALESGPSVEGFDPADSSSLSVRLVAGAWLPRLGGDARLGTAGAAGDWLDFDQHLDQRDIEPTFNAELTLRKGDDWALHFSGFHFSSETAGNAPLSLTFGDLAIPAGEPFRASFDLTSVAAEVRFRYLPEPLAGDENSVSDGRRRVDLRFAPLAGARWIDVDQRLQRPGNGSAEGGGEWVGVYGGVNFALLFRPEGALPWCEALTLEAGAAAGPALGGDGGFMWQVNAGLTWHITEHAGLMFGYRLLELDVENGDYELEGGLQGLFLAGSLRF